MEPSIGTIDPIARLVSYIGLGIAITVGVIHFLAYRRGRWQNPIINIHVSKENALLLSKPRLLVVKFIMGNPSALPNTVIEVSCKVKRKWFKSSSLTVGNLELTFVDVQTLGGKWTSDLRLAIAPQVALDQSDWKIVLEPGGSPLKDGLWRLPLSLSVRSPRTLVVAITSEYERIDETKEITITFRDITYKRHSCSLKLRANI